MSSIGGISGGGYPLSWLLSQSGSAPSNMVQGTSHHHHSSGSEGTSGGESAESSESTELFGGESTVSVMA